MRSILLIVISLLSGTLSLSAQGKWTISVENKGTAGGYIINTDGKSVGDYPYTSDYPGGAHLPCWVVRFPKGTYTVSSANLGTVDVRNMNTGEDLVTGQSAKQFGFRAPATAWYRILLRGGRPNRRMSDFSVSSSDVRGADAVYLADWRSIPSLHLNGFQSTDGRLPSGNAFDWIYDEVLIPEESDFVGTYVEAFGFNNGYIGIQNNGRLSDGKENRTVIFSTWDNGDTDQDKALADFKRSGVIAIDSTLKNTVAERFGGEGTGVHVLLHGPYWKPGKWVRFLLNVRPEEIRLKDGSTFRNTIISAWYNARGVDDKWHYISSQRMAGQVQFFGSGFNAFLEEYTRGATSQGIAPHRAYYRRVFTRSMQGGEWYNRNIFWFGHTDGGSAKGARNDRYQTGTTLEGEPAILMQSGGYIEPRDHNGNVKLAYQEGGNYLPSASELDELLKRDVLPAVQTQDVDRMQTALNDTYADLPQKEWKVTAFSSQETAGENNGRNGLARLVLDGDKTTFWHTEWMSGSHNNYPHSITFAHEGDADLEKIMLTTDDGHTNAAQYLARNVQVHTAPAARGPWTLAGTFALPASTTQVIEFERPLSLPSGHLLRLTFIKGFGNGDRHFMALSEVNFKVKDLTRLRKLVEQQYENAGRFNGYPRVDVERCLSDVHEHLATASGTEIEAALKRLAQESRLIKYGPVTRLSDLSAARAYVLTNAHGLGTLAADGEGGTPTLRGVDSPDETTASESYREAPELSKASASWMIVGVDHGRTSQYLVYNVGNGKFLNPAGAEASWSEEPVFVEIRKFRDDFLLTPLRPGTRRAGYEDFSARPSQPGVPFALSSSSRDKGRFWTISDNYAVTPAPSLIEALRKAALGEPFKRPTGAAFTVAPSTTAADVQFDLSGRRVNRPVRGTIVISAGKKHPVR